MMPFDFILDFLYPETVHIKKMFGQHAVYIEDKIVLATRKNKDKPKDNGIGVATDFEHHENLKRDFPALKSISLYNIKKWLFIPEEKEEFESVARDICELIKKKDKRIGVIKR